MFCKVYILMVSTLCPWFQEPREKGDARYSYFWPVENVMGYPDATLDARRTFDFDQSTGGKVFFFFFITLKPEVE